VGVRDGKREEAAGTRLGNIKKKKLPTVDMIQKFN